MVRTGGEEFVILMAGTERHAAAMCCERLRTALRDEPWHRIAAGLRVTASVGFAAATHPVDLDALALAADRRLYAAKRAGRDRVVGDDADAQRPSAA